MHHLSAATGRQPHDSAPAAASDKTAPRRNRAPARPSRPEWLAWIARWSVRDRYPLFAKQTCRHACGHTPKKRVQFWHRQYGDSRLGWERNGYGSWKWWETTLKVRLENALFYARQPLPAASFASFESRNG